MRNSVLFLALMSFCSCNAGTKEATTGQTLEPIACSVSVQFQDEIRATLKQKKWEGYPDPPDLSCEVWDGLYAEIGSDRMARSHFASLTGELAAENHDVIAYFQKERRHFALLAIAVHSNPDTRIDAVGALRTLSMLRLLAKMSDEGKRRHRKMEKEIGRYFLAILDQTPWAISGSENSTIHGVYIASIATTLQFVVKDIPPDPKVPSQFDFTEEDVAKWRAGVAR